MAISWEFSPSDIIVLGIIIGFVILFFVIRYILQKTSVPEGIDKNFIREQWAKIEELIGFGQEMNYKLAVIESDKLLDYVLKAMFFPGNTMAERMKNASYKYPEIKKVWWAHKVRNHIVHDTQYAVKYGEAKKVLSLFKDALRAFNAL
jgi:hypothetical protein